MYRVVIAEDEMFVRLGLKNSIDWTRFNMKVIADVSDGASAWAICEKEIPELVITDLKMPVMDGMALIAKIRENNRNMRIIILTCLEEFELVTKAMSMGVSGYISKFSMREDEMTAILENVKGELDASSQSLARMAIKEVDKDAIKEKVMKGFIFLQLYTDDEFAGYVKELDIHLCSRNLTVCVMEIEQYGTLKEVFQDEQGHLIKLSMMNLLNEVVTGFCTGEVINETNERYVLILNFDNRKSPEDNAAFRTDLLTKIKEFIKMYLNVSVSFGISGIRDGFGSMRDLYKEASRALANRFLTCASNFCHEEAEYDGIIVIEKMKRLLSRVQEHVVLDTGFTERFMLKVGQIAENTWKVRTQIGELCDELLNQCGLSIAMKLEQYGSILTKCNRKLAQCETIDEMTETVVICLFEMKHGTGMDLVVGKEIKGAIRYIEENYDQDISLKTVASHISLSPTYLSHLFKKEIKINFVDYLLSFRIEKAKELLLGTYLKAYEIALKTGFHDDSYFSRAFKRVVGENPGEYRKKRLAEWRSEWDENGN